METWIKQSWTDLKTIIVRPKDFFDRILQPENLVKGLGGPIVFGLLCHWIGAAFSFFFGTVVNEMMTDVLAKFLPAGAVADNLLVTLLFGGALVVLDPVFNLFKLTVGSLVTMVSASLFFPKILPDGTPAKALDFELIFRISLYCEAPSLFRIVPLMGDMAAWLYRYYLLAVGLHRATGHSIGRALWVVVFPHLVLFFLGISLIVLLFAVIVGVAVQ